MQQLQGNKVSGLSLFSNTGSTGKAFSATLQFSATLCSFLWVSLLFFSAAITRAWLFYYGRQQ
jgi:hypothetical protein